METKHINSIHFPSIKKKPALQFDNVQRYVLWTVCCTFSFKWKHFISEKYNKKPEPKILKQNVLLLREKINKFFNDISVHSQQPLSK